MPCSYDDETNPTTNHPWLSADRGWILASFLRLGEPVRRVDGTTAVVVAVEAEPGAAAMWDLTVSNVHTFAVGSSAFVVHNSNCKPSSTELDKNLGGTTGDGMQAHHLIPRELAGHDLVQMAMKGGWEMDGAANGVLLRDATHATANEMFHNGAHAMYSRMVRGMLDDSLGDLVARGDLNPSTADGAVRTVAGQARSWILANTGRLS